MREIKFRAWCEKDRHMMSWREVLNLQEDSRHAWPDYDMFAESELKFMQFTGLRDKNGKEIYEGDICDWCGPGKFTYGNRFAVSWDEWLASWHLGKLFNPVDMPYCEIISNIYENPELIATCN